MLKLYRSKDFRPTFGRLTEIRALVHSGTPLMACTATASRSVKKEVIDCLEMCDCAEVTASLDRPNVFYDVKPRTDVEADFRPLVNTLRKKQLMLPEYWYTVSPWTCVRSYMRIFTMSCRTLHTIPEMQPTSVTTVSLGCFMPTQQGCHPQEPFGF